MQAIVWFFGIPLALAGIMLLFVCVEWSVVRVEQTTAHWRDHWEAWRMHTADKASRERNHRAFLDWLEAQAGTGQTDGGIDYEIVEAQHQGELIRVFIEHELPNAVSRCLETHRLMAQVTGAHEYNEIAYEPECYTLRAQVVWLLSHGADLIRAYPLRFNDMRMLHNGVLLQKRALPTCQHCPYIELAVHEAPRLCPTAELVQLRSANP